MVYYTRHTECKALAGYLRCHCYHGKTEGSNANFISQRETGFQAWLRGEMFYIVATAALGTGIGMPRIPTLFTWRSRAAASTAPRNAGRLGQPESVSLPRLPSRTRTGRQRAPRGTATYAFERSKHHVAYLARKRVDYCKHSSGLSTTALWGVLFYNPERYTRGMTRLLEG